MYLFIYLSIIFTVFDFKRLFEHFKVTTARFPGDFQPFCQNYVSQLHYQLKTLFLNLGRYLQRPESHKKSLKSRVFYQPIPLNKKREIQKKKQTRAIMYLKNV